MENQLKINGKSTENQWKTNDHPCWLMTIGALLGDYTPAMENPKLENQWLLELNSHQRTGWSLVTAWRRRRKEHLPVPQRREGQRRQNVWIGRHSMNFAYFQGDEIHSQYINYTKHCNWPCEPLMPYFVVKHSKETVRLILGWDLQTCSPHPATTP